MDGQIVEYIKYGVYLLFGSGIIFEVAPIKFSPISMILGWLGKKLNRDMKTDIDKLQEEILSVKGDLQSHKIESWRRNILDFADALMRGEAKSKENYCNIISLHDSYVEYLNKYNLDNGQVTLAFEYITSCYQECMKNNSFYDGK